MKKMKQYLFFALLLLSVACKKNVLPFEPIEKPGKGESETYTCAPDYGDSILCYQWLAGLDYKISPTNPGRGKYVADPMGLAIDSVTGEINVTQSESGLAYRVGFIANGSADTCFTRVITSGINYLDGIHDLSKDDTLAIPVYNASLAAYPVCGTGGLFSSCEFDDDDDDDNGNGLADEPPPGQTLNSRNIVIDKTTGVISLKRSVLGGLFSMTPVNGSTVQGTLYYRLNDCSNKALRKIDIKITYYHTLADVPAALVNDITNSVNNILNGVLGLLKTTGSKPRQPRPPHIIVVANS